MTGESSNEQNIKYFRGGKPSYGKSIIFEALGKLMIDIYVSKTNSDFMDANANLRKEVATWRGLRLLWVDKVTT